MSAPTPIVIAGFGNVGQQLATRLRDDDKIRIEAIVARDAQKARAACAKIGISVPIIGAHEAPGAAPVVVECANYDAFRVVVEPSLAAGSHVVAISVGALVGNLDLIDIAAAHGGTLHIANGTAPGIDILRAAAEGAVESVVLTTRLPPRSLAKEAFVAKKGIDLAAVENGPITIFEGTAREAAGEFPRHMNVTVALALAGIGLDRTRIRIVADGDVPGTHQHLAIRSDTVTVDMSSQNLPSPANPRTSAVVAPSIIAALRRIGRPLVVGS